MEYISLILDMIIGLFSYVLGEPILLILILAAIVGVIVSIIIENKRIERLRKSGIFEVDEMKGEVFEEYLYHLLSNRRYKVRQTTASGDYGADLILTDGYEKVVVQVKRYKKKVGIKAVQEVVSAKNYYGADECWVITNNYFTEPAKKLSFSNDVRLIERDELVSWMLEEKSI